MTTPLLQFERSEISGNAATAAGATSEIENAVERLEEWIRARDYAGYEPFDLMNSPYAGAWARRFPFSLLIRQYGRRFAGLNVRQTLRVPASKNCKALGLILAGYCDRARSGRDSHREAGYIKSELRRLRSPGEQEYCWGYDWDAISLRAGNVMPAFSPNAVATVFCASALLDMAEVFGDKEAFAMAASAGQFFVSRLNRPVDTGDKLCFSYTPGDRSRIYNSSALVSAFLARLAFTSGDKEHVDLARRGMRYIIGEQLANGAWYYGATRWQKWIDSFHTGYNLDSLLDYRTFTGETFVDDSIRAGYDYYKKTFFSRRAVTYYNNRRYPIDVHSCSQAILTFCRFASEDDTAMSRALDAADWTLENMRDRDGSFYYQVHRLWTNKMPYMRWSQAWMFKSLARLERQMNSPAASRSKLS